MAGGGTDVLNESVEDGRESAFKAISGLAVDGRGTVFISEDCAFQSS